MRSSFRAIVGSGAFAGAALGALSIASADPPAYYNLAQTFDPVKQEMADGGVGNIAVIGDSLSFRAGTWLYPFIDSMEANYGDAGAGYQGFSLQSGAGFDSGWTEGAINTDISPYHSLDGLWASTGVATTASFQPSDQSDNPVSNQSYTLQYITQPGGGSFQQFYWGTNGEIPTATISTNSSTTGVGQTTFAANSTGSNTPWIQTNGDGPVTILGQVDSTGNPGAMISRMANGGWGINDFLQRDYTFDDQLQLLNPSLYIIWLGQNDQWETSPTDYASLVEQLVNRIKADTPEAQFCLVGSYDNDDNIAITNEGMYLAAQDEDCGYINLYDDAGTYQFFVDNNYLADGIHFSDAGGDYMGQLMYDAFETDGESLVPEPASAACCLVPMASLCMLRRRRTA